VDFYSPTSFLVVRRLAIWLLLVLSLSADVCWGQSYPSGAAEQAWNEYPGNAVDGPILLQPSFNAEPTSRFQGSSILPPPPIVSYSPEPTTREATSISAMFEEMEQSLTILQPSSFEAVETPQPFMASYFSPEMIPRVRIIQPKARVYIDGSPDRPGKLDIFRDGQLSATVDLVEIFLPQPWTRFPGMSVAPNDVGWRHGFTLGVGISYSVSAQGTSPASNAPVILYSVGYRATFPLSPLSNYQDTAKAPRVGLEVGLARGRSTDENLGEGYDWAAYLGITMDLP